RFRVLVTLAGAFERRCAPDYDPSERFWGATYDDWVRQAERADRLAQLALVTKPPQRPAIGSGAEE
ncbi:hypothetical protein, partial [Klebsiella pneumoniae]|uniref:hypothetical protein n=1 Tax=Klebsiella pneumoniae TaxID=573 RepID=UPI0025A10A92